MKLSKYYFRHSFIKDGESYELFFVTRTDKIFAIDSETWNAVQSGQLNKLDDATIANLHEKGLLTSEENELEALIRENKDKTAKDTELYFVVQATASCQLGCIYCGQNHSAKCYSDKEVELLAKFIIDQIKEKSATSLKLGLFGAEPLLALSQNLKLVEILRKYLGENFLISSKMATNGLKLTYDVLKTLHQKAGLNSVDVTLDGIASIHDQRRLLKNGRKSFELIWNNLEAVHHLLSDTLKINIRCNVDSHSIEFVDDFLEFLAKHEWVKKMTIYFAPVHSWGNDAHKRISEMKKLSEDLLNAKLKAMAMGLSVDGFLPNRTFKACIAMDKSSLVIDPSLQTYTCTEIPLVNSYKNHETSSGRIDQYNRRDYSHFYTEILEKKWPCTSCPLLPSCGGACPKSWKEGHPACPPIKLTMDKTLTFLAKQLFNAQDEDQQNEIITG